MYSLLAAATNHPDRVNRLWGLFNHRSLAALTRRGVDVEAVVPRPHAPPVGPYSEYRSIPDRDRSFPYPVTHPRFLYYLPKSLLYHRTGDSVAAALRSHVDARSYDAFHGCHLYPDGYALSELATEREVPLTTYAHGTIVNDFETFNAGTRERIRTTLRRADRVFCSGRAVRSRAEAIEPDVAAEVVPIGATPEHFPTDRRGAVRRELGVPDDRTLVVFCGHLTDRKGIGDLVDVLPDLAGEDLYVVCIGHGGDLREEVRAALARPDTPPGKLRWQLSPVAVRRWFAAADLLVLPSYSEGRPTVVYEAMAARTPVLATDVGGVPEQVQAGETGWLVEPGDTAALRARLRSLSATDLDGMGAAAHDRLVEQGWTWAAHAERIVAAHTALLEDRGAGPDGRADEVGGPNEGALGTDDSRDARTGDTGRVNT
jgi:glycosyltransferase involved in cell wall biosynthesis